MKIKNYVIHDTQYYETDQMGVIHHANYVKWMEEARKEFLKSIGLYIDKLDDNNIYLAVLYESVKYLKAIRFDEQIEIKCYLKEITNVKIEFYYEFNNINKKCICAKGETSHCIVDKKMNPILLKKTFPKEYELMKKLVNSDEIL